MISTTGTGTAGAAPKHRKQSQKSMAQIPKAKVLSWTHHAQAKMNFYRLSESRVRRVLNSPKRVEEGVAPRTVAMMQPASIKRSGGRAGASKLEKWVQEIWVMVQDIGDRRKVISAWRYPGVTRPRSGAAMDVMRREYNEFKEAESERN